MNKKFDDWLEQQLGLKTATPTYPALNSVPAKDAREKVDEVFHDFLVEAEAWSEKHTPGEDEEEDSPFSDFAAEHTETETPPPPVHAACIPTGVGKTQQGIARIAEDIKTHRAAGDMRSRLYLVPRHWLGEDIDEQFRKLHGLTAKVYRGLSAPDPSIPGNMERPKDEQEQMCLAREKRELAEALHKSVSQSCCKYKKQRCEFHPEGRGRRKCGYQTQQLGEQPDVWIAAHNMLFHPQKAFGDIAGIIIDEGFALKTGVYGIGRKRKKNEDEIPGMLLDDLAADGDACPWRKELIEILQGHPLGGLRADLVDTICNNRMPTRKHYTTKEWDIVNSLKLTPEMSPAQIKEIRESEQAAKCRRARWMVGTWGALFELLENDHKKNFDIRVAEGNKNLLLAERKKDGKVEVSGRLVLDKNKAGKLVLQRRGIRPVVKSRKVPTFIMDATLPGEPILKVFFPQVKIVADIKVDMPEHVRVKQVLDAPTTELKLWGRGEEAKGKNREDVKRFILQWWLEDDRRSMLVVCQQKYERWLRDNLPKEIVLPRRFKGEVPRESKVIAIEHFNNVSGLDRYKNVSSILLVGRIQPSPEAVEAYAGALTGTEPEIKIPSPEPGQPRKWYKSVPRAIRMKDGSGVLVERCDLHPDPMCEAVRLLLCEGEMIQALGRARAINRDAPEKALKVGILANVVLDLTVDSVQRWEAPNEMIEPLALDGLVLTAEMDMAKAWPDIWKTADAAKRTLKKLRAAARRGGEGFQGLFSSIKHTLGKRPRNTSDNAAPSSAHGGANTEDNPSSIAAVPYQQERGRGQRLREALVDLRIWPSPREGLMKKLGYVPSVLLQILSRREIGKPLAGAGKVAINDNLVWVLVRETLDQLFDRAAKHPWRKLPEKRDHTLFCEAEEYAKLPTELRMRALGLHEMILVCGSKQ
jgi:hypothetical protein